MASKVTTIVVTHRTEALQTIKDLLQKSGSKARQECNQIQKFFGAVAGGNRDCSFTVQCDTGDGVAATGTFTFSAAASANDTVLVNGVTFTCVASGATGNQWNAGSTATQTATNLAAAIAGSATALVNQHVTATSALGVVTVTSKYATPVGNAVTIAKGTDAGSVNTVSGARLTGGAFPGTISGPNTYHAGA